MKKDKVEKLAEKLILLSEINKEKFEYLKGYIDAKLEEER